MRFLQTLLRSYSIFIDVLRMNVAGSGRVVQMYGLYPPHSEAGSTHPPCPLPVVMAVEWVHGLRFWLLVSLESALTKQLCHLAYRLITAKLGHRLRFDMLITILQKQCVCVY